MKTILTILIAAICFSASAYETYETNHWHQYNILTGESKSGYEIKTNVVPDSCKWATNVIYIQQFPANCITNYIPPVRLEPSTWQGRDTTNVVILNDYTGTIQVGTNFYTTRELVK